MPSLKLEQFGGALPAWDPHLLPVGQAARSVNGYLFSGALQGWRKPTLLRSLSNALAQSVYRIPTFSATQALAYLVFKSQPTAGDYVDIGEVRYTFRASIDDVSLPFEVKIGADTTSTATNLLAAITTNNRTNSGEETQYGKHTQINRDVLSYTADQTPRPGLPAPYVEIVSIGGTNYAFLQVGSVDYGEAFNTIEVAESTSNTRLTWLYDLLSFSSTTTTYRGGNNPALSTDLEAASTWMEFEDKDTLVVKSQVADDQWQRYYFTSPSQPPKYNLYDRIVAGQPAWRLGVPAPPCSPGVSVVGGGNNLTLGNTTTGGGNYSGLANFVYLTKITTPGATQIQDVQVFMSSLGVENTAARWAALVYNDDDGVPGSLLNTGQIITGFFPDAANISSFVNPINLQGNTSYWIGFMADSAGNWASGPAGVNGTAKFSNTFDNGPPATAPSGANITLNDASIQMFADCISDDVVDARAYVYTWVTAYGEEGPPSPPTLLDGWSNGVWTVTLFDPPADDMGVTRNIKNINIYRTIPDQGGTTTFFLVDTVPVGTQSYEDNPLTHSDDVVALNLQLPSANWFPPPDNLQGLITLPNGIMAGFVDNEVWFCQPFFPHAWPPGFVQTVDYPIVGLGVANGALVVCTNSVPYVLNGISPDAMALTKCGEAHPCHSAGGILSGDQGVYYLSHNGLILVTSSGQAKNTTDLWFTREQWAQLTPQSNAKAIHLASCFFCYGRGTEEGFTIELDQDNMSFTIWPQPGGHRLGFNELTPHALPDEPIVNILTDAWTGAGLVIQDGKVYYYKFSDPDPELVTYTWVSKTYQQNTKKNYSAMKAFFTVPSGTPAQNELPFTASFTDPRWGTLQEGQYGIIKTYVDLLGNGSWSLIDCREIRENGAVMRIRSGFKAEQWKWEVNARVVISGIQIATSVKDLANA